MFDFRLTSKFLTARLKAQAPKDRSAALARTHGANEVGPRPDVDVVITWVDGDDPVLQEKRSRYMKTDDVGGAAPTRNATQRRRFSDNDEIRYCLRSIYNHAPWVRRVWIVTDNQKPSSIDFSKVKNDWIRIVDHRDIFLGFEDMLPTFNSSAIETMLWRIPGLAERYLYFNDDMFFTRPVKPTDFFVGEKVKLRGNWIGSGDGTPVSPHGQRRLNGAKFLGFTEDRVFAATHVIYPNLRSIFEALFEEHREDFAGNAAYRFRSTSQFGATSIHNHYAIKHGMANLRKGRDLVHFSVLFCKNASVDETIERLERLKQSSTIAGCLNFLEAVEAKVPNVIDYIDQVTGPKAPFET